MIGFTDIVVFQNNSFDTTQRTLQTLIDMGVIRYFNNFKKPSIKADFQNRACRRAARLPEYGQANWCMALDGGEFLRVNAGQGRVQDLITAMDDAVEIHLNWRIFGNSHLRALDSRMVTERFTLASEITLPPRYPMPVKTLFRTDRFLMKAARGSSSHPDRAIALDYLKKRNLNRDEERTFANLADAIRDEVRSRALKLWRQRITDIKAVPEMQGLWERLV